MSELTDEAVELLRVNVEGLRTIIGGVEEHDRLSAKACRDAVNEIAAVRDAIIGVSARDEPWIAGTLSDLQKRLKALKAAAHHPAASGQIGSAADMVDHFINSRPFAFDSRGLRFD